MKNLKLLFALMFFVAIAISSCSKDDSAEVKEPDLVGQDGNPRFNLQFTNPDNVDLDLYVQTPSGKIIYYGNPTAELGSLDVDCRCGECSEGPNENIFWANGTAPAGTYKYWIEYYDYCAAENASSTYTLRIIKNGTVLETKTGVLTSGMTTKWTFQHTN